jgi:deoxycytidylate deaminase
MPGHPYGIEAPPPELVARAIEQARNSPCAKSRRGSVAYLHFDNPRHTRIVGTGYNHPPGEVRCDGSARCHADCGKRCIHAVAAAIYDTSRTPLACDLLHVEIDTDAQLVAGGPPSCVDCSKAALHAGVRGAWLYQQYKYQSFEIGCWICGLPSSVTAPFCGKCREMTVPPVPAWVFYPAAEFHRRSREAKGVY